MSTLNLENIKHPDSASNNISVDSTGRTGVGTGTPTATLHVEGGSNTQMRVSSTGAEANLTLAGGSYSQINNTTGALYVTNNNAEDIYFRTASTTRMTVDSAGRVTMPYQACFRANLNSNVNLTAGTTTKVTGWGTVGYGSFNDGGYWSNANSRFTAPVGGKYLFNATTLFNLPSGWRRLYFYINGTLTAEFLHGGHSYSSSWDHATGSAILHLNAGDYFELYADSEQSGYMYTGYTQLDGYLLG